MNQTFCLNVRIISIITILSNTAKKRRLKKIDKDFLSAKILVSRFKGRGRE